MATGRRKRLFLSRVFQIYTTGMFATKRFALRTTRANIWKRLATGSSFVSKHYELDNPGCIPEFLERKKISFSVSSSHYRIRECPFCHDIKGQKDNMFKLHIDRIKGLYFCHRCGSRGNWLGFRHKVSLLFKRLNYCNSLSL